MFEYKNKVKKMNIGIQFFAENSEDVKDNLETSLDYDAQNSNENAEAENQEINFETGEMETTSVKEPFSVVLLKNIFDILEVFAYAVALMVFAFLFVVKFVTVDGSSMLTTLHDEDRLIVYQLFYTPETDDVIVINLKARDELLVKRVIGVAGDTIKIKFDTWEIWVNGEYLEQPYLNYNPDYLNKEEMIKGHFFDLDEDNSVTLTVEEGKVFVLGDNRNHSSDSRVYGQLDVNEIMGKVVCRVYPFESVGKIQ